MHHITSTSVCADAGASFFILLRLLLHLHIWQEVCVRGMLSPAHGEVPFVGSCVCACHRPIGTWGGGLSVGNRCIEERGRKMMASTVGTGWRLWWRLLWCYVVHSCQFHACFVLRKAKRAVCGSVQGLTLKGECSAWGCVCVCHVNNAMVACSWQVRLLFGQRATAPPWLRVRRLFRLWQGPKAGGRPSAHCTLRTCWVCVRLGCHRVCMLTTQPSRQHHQQTLVQSLFAAAQQDPSPL